MGRSGEIKQMNPHVIQEIITRMRSLDNHALLRLVAIEHSDYLPEAIDFACDEIEIRGLKVLTAEQYLNLFPAERISSNGFCQKCCAQTTDESPGNTQTINLVFGNRLMGHLDRCNICGSVLQAIWFWFVIPIFPIGKYRVIYLERGMFTGRYIGRKLRKLN